MRTASPPLAAPGVGEVVSCFNESDVAYAWEYNLRTAECGVLNNYGCLNTVGCCKALKLAGDTFLLLLGLCSANCLHLPSLAGGWLFLSHAVSGILHVQIVLSHWSMHSYVGRAYTGPDDEWYITTMRTTMNVDTPKWLDFVHIGLQFQIEHHLFPRLPRHNLRLARDMVREVVEAHFPAGSAECKRLFPLGVAYHEPGFFAGELEQLRVAWPTPPASHGSRLTLLGNLEMWRVLRGAAYAARGAKRGSDGRPDRPATAALRSRAPHAPRRAATAPRGARRTRRRGSPRRRASRRAGPSGAARSARQSPRPWPGRAATSRRSPAAEDRLRRRGGAG